MTDYSTLFGQVHAAATTPRVASDYGLSDEQQAALNAPFDQSAVICAGAGAGKTRLLVERVAALLRAGADPERIAVVTFTRKAANEMSARIKKRLGSVRQLPVCSTVHSLALTKVLKKGELFQLATPVQELSILTLLEPFLPEEFDGLSDTELLLMLHRAREESAYRTTTGLLALAYEEQLAAAGLDDFTTLLSRGCAAPANLFDHVLVDETQDLSRLQLDFLRAVGPDAKFWFVGDPDQGIYSFRGAQASMMHRLRDETGVMHTLATNYRSARSIVVHANNVIANNPDRFPVQWRTHRQDEGSVKVEFHEHGILEKEATLEWLAASPNTRCVLARTQALVLPFKEQHLPAMTVHESKGLEWEEVKVIGCEAALFPHPLGAREEERRLFYVAMTRAKTALILSCSSSRATKKVLNNARSPSAFLYETQALSAKT